MAKYIFSIILSLVLISPVSAQTTTDNNNGGGIRGGLKDIFKNTREQIRDVKESAREEIKNARQDVREEIKDVRGNVREEIKNKKQELGKELSREAIEQFKQKRDEAKQIIEAKRGEFKQKVEAKRAELKDKIQAKREELKERLVKIKDERKKQVVEKVDARLDEINKNRLDHFSAVLEKLEKILANIGNRAGKAEANGKDVSAVKTAITDATNAIAAARLAIQTQAGKTYKIEINTEDKLRVDVGNARQALHADLVAVQDKVKAAREAVHKAATTLAQIQGVDKLEVSTSTATATPTATSSQ